MSGNRDKPREGKEIYTGETWLERDDRLQRVIFRVVQRMITATCQHLLMPELDIDTWWTSLSTRQASSAQVIELYCQHDTSEQFHSEIKSELDLERLPSGEFAINALLLSLGLVAYNVLRLCGQAALDENQQLPPEEKLPLSKPVFRRRLRSMVQNLMHLAARLTRHSSRWGLELGSENPWRFA